MSMAPVYRCFRGRVEADDIQPPSIRTLEHGSLQHEQVGTVEHYDAGAELPKATAPS
jgi:hypothetical protein